MTEPATLAPAERAKCRAAFASGLNKLVECEAYLCLTTRRLTFRSVAATRRFRLPDDALPIGHYSWPFPSATFLQDLDCALARFAARFARS